MNVVDRLNKAMNFEETYPVPVALWDVAPWMPSMFGVNCKEYYLNPDIKLNILTKLQETFPEAILFPGIFPDYGVVVEASAYGSELLWLDDDAPYAHGCIHEIDDILKLKQINPNTDGLMPRVLEEWSYLRKNAKAFLSKDYGYFEGHAFIIGPVETAAMLRGYDKFFIDFFINTAMVHKLLDIVTEGLISWIKAQEKCNGKLSRLFVVDHVSTQLSPAHFDEFFMPYLKRIFQEFNYANLRLWHNEGRSNHVYDKLTQIGFNIYNFGADPVAQIKKAVGDKLCLMGNLDPVKVVQKKSYQEIYDCAVEAIKQGGNGGGFLLSGGGGLAPKTKVENVRAIIDAAQNFKRN
ncbi:uroporphyrinogen decarboxylase family protein [Desulfitibacter alkalitolerans]|uniref:uroporphyrinogen decarboxylase family protein n=1 Tax=Desulfitibacter alkalitolerans TaxID=264641 RepID=UPI0004824954|nr:uroporphyrinogen decarboxylase family protein [Desulfitibacter alkalitolerans]